MSQTPPAEVEIVRHALDRVPLSLIVDDSCPLVNLNYFFLRDRIAHTGQWQRWEDVPVVIPERFAREFGEWCLAQGVRGKYSIVPCPAGIGRIDQGLPLFGKAQLESWLAMCREVIVPAFDITPEMLTHTFVLDLHTMQPLPSRIWEQWEWATLDPALSDHLRDYMALACQILANVGLPPAGVTSPGGFGGRSLPLYARLAGEAVRSVTGNPTPYFFQRVAASGPVATPVWYAERGGSTGSTEGASQSGQAVGEIIACVGDHTGSWTGYGEADADIYIAEDLQGGRLPQVIGAGDPCVLVSHWQGFYGLHDSDRRGFRVLQTVVKRLRALDPTGEHTRWRTPSEITTYACARELARVEWLPAEHGGTLRLDLPVLAPDLTLRLSHRRPQAVLADGVPLRRVASKRAFQRGTFYQEGEGTLLAYTPSTSRSVITLQ